MKGQPSRRALFGSAALLATLPAYARPHGPDHDLTAVCGAFIATCERYLTLEAAAVDGRVDRRELSAIFAAWGSQLDQMEPLRAVTADGIQVRALALHHDVALNDPSLDYPDTQGGRLLAYLLRDAATLGGATWTPRAATSSPSSATVR